MKMLPSSSRNSHLYVAVKTVTVINRMYYSRLASNDKVFFRSPLQAFMFSPAKTVISWLVDLCDSGILMRERVRKGDSLTGIGQIDSLDYPTRCCTLSRWHDTRLFNCISARNCGFVYRVILLDVHSKTSYAIRLCQAICSLLRQCTRAPPQSTSRMPVLFWN